MRFHDELPPDLELYCDPETERQYWYCSDFHWGWMDALRARPTTGITATQMHADSLQAAPPLWLKPLPLPMAGIRLPD